MSSRDPVSVPEKEGAASPPPMSGRWTRLRAVTDEDYEFLFSLSTSEELGFRWRHRGETPSPEAFVQTLWHRVFAQFIILSTRTEQRLGVLMGYDANLRNGIATYAMLARPELIRTGLTLEAGALFINYLFTLWDFRKLYAETLGFNYELFSSGAGRFFHEEGRLRDHEYFNGRYWDFHVLAFYREDWQRLIRPYLAGLTPSQGPRS